MWRNKLLAIIASCAVAVFLIALLVGFNFVGIFKPQQHQQNCLRSNALDKAVNYLVNNYNRTIGLIPETPNSKTYWLYTDNFLASLVFHIFDKNNSTLVRIGSNISKTIASFGYPAAINKYMVLNYSVSYFDGSKN